MLLLTLRQVKPGVLYELDQVVAIDLEDLTPLGVPSDDCDHLCAAGAVLNLDAFLDAGRFTEHQEVAIHELDARTRLARSGTAAHRELPAAGDLQIDLRRALVEPKHLESQRATLAVPEAR